MLRRRKRERALGEEDDREWSASADLIDDTMASIQLCLNRNSGGFAALARFCHRVRRYTILPNRTFIDQNVHRLRSQGKLITFKVASGTEDLAILRVEGYIAEVKKYENVFREQLRQHPGDPGISSKLNAMAAYGRALPQISSLATVPLKVLAAFLGMDGGIGAESAHAMVGRIQRLGFLLPATRLDNEAYSFFLPGVGKLVSAIKKTRTLILGTLKRTKYKEMHEQQLKKAKLKDSHFQFEFHLADMEGCGLIRRIEVSSGVLIALADNS